ncbi:MAG: hypothetical protein KatS3mg079_284 [Caloramator sp.]|nr:MAG: hypothetical protein KatS3mg079_284 [Caloramator sp.]
MKKTKTTLLILFMLLIVSFTVYWALGFKRTNAPQAQTKQENIAQDSRKKEDTNKDESKDDLQQSTEQNAGNNFSNVNKENNVVYTGNSNSKKDVDNIEKEDTGMKNENKKDNWKLVWSDEFNGKELDLTKWGYDIGNALLDANGNKIADGWGNNEKQYYTDSKNNVYVKDGKLMIVARKENVTDQFGTVLNYTSGKIKTKGKYSKKYGRIEVRAKLPEGKGLWPAIWMLPEKDTYGGWAASGEIDIMEAWGSNPNKVAGTIHYGSTWPNNTYTGKEYLFSEGQSVSSDFHTYAIEWEPGEIRWYVDGNLYQVQNNWYSKDPITGEKFSFPAPFDQNFYIILNLAVGGNWDGEPDENTNFPKAMQVDYVRVYELVGRQYKTPVEPLVEVEPLPEGSKLPTSDGNYVYNGDFSKNEIQENADGSLPFGTVWNFVHVPDFGGNGSVSIDQVNDSNFAKVNITSPGTQDYAVQLIQIVPMGKGRWYRLSFDAKTDTSRTINVKIGGGAERGWTSYTDNFKVELTSDVKHFENVFQMQKDSDAFARLEFQLGLSTKPVWIGNVRLEEIPAPQIDFNASKEPLLDGNHIYNGTFDKGNIDRMTYWNFVVDGAKANAQVLEETRELKVDIKNGGTRPEAIVLYQRGIQLLKDNEYRLTFKGRADLPRTIEVAFLNKNGSINYLTDNTVNITKSMQEYVIDFKMQYESDFESQIVFKLGGNNSNVYIDDVKLIKTSNPIDYANIEIYPLKNGDFSKGLEMWKPYPNIGDGADSTITAENGEAKISVRNAGPNPWSILLNQEGFRLYKDVEYVLAFDVRASEKRNIEVVIDNATYYRYFSKVVEAPKGSEMKHYEFTFKMDKDEIANLKFLLGKTDDSVPSEPHDIYIDNVVLEVKYNMIKNGEFAEGTNNWIHFMANWEGAYSTFNVENGEAKIHIDFEGTEFWSTQLAQEGLNIEKGKTYVISFDARASIDRKIQVIIEQNGGAYTKYLEPQVADLTNQMKRFTFEFTMNNETDPNAHIVFALGRIDGNKFPLQSHDVYIDNVVLKPKQIEEINNDDNNSGNDDGAMIKNGEFAEGTNNWIHFMANWEGAYSTFNVENGEAKIHIDFEGTEFWSTQLAQEGLKIEKGKTYVISFDARASIDRKIQVIIEQNGGAYTKYLEPQVADLTNEMKRFTFEFTMNNETDPNAHIVFALGRIDGNKFPLQSHDVYIDNVVLEVK